MHKQTVPERSLPTRNVTLLAELVSRVKDRVNGLQGMGGFQGPTGWGKTKAACSCAVTHNAYYVQMKTLWSKRYLLEKIAQQMNLSLIGSMPHLLEKIGEELGDSGSPLIIDDAHIVAEKGWAGMLRDFYDASQGTIILVGEEMLSDLLERVERVHGMMLDVVEAEPVSMDDAALFADWYCQGIKVETSLLERIVEAVNGSARYACSNLARVAEFARLRGLETIDAETYTDSLLTNKRARNRR